MKNWTICGHFEDNGQPWVEWVQAPEWMEAVKKAIKKMKARHGAEFDPDNMIIGHAFQGRKVSHLEQDSISSALSFTNFTQDFN
jgi:hypothetical protein